MARHSFRIGKALKIKKRHKQDHWYRKHGHPSERRDLSENGEPFDEGQAFLTWAYLSAVLRKGGSKK